MSEAPCTLAWPRRGMKPVPGRPTWPVISDRLAIASAPSTPLSCWVIPMPHSNMPRSGRGVDAGRLADEPWFDAGDASGLFGAVSCEVLPEGLEIFGACGDEGGVARPPDDDVRDGVEKRHIGAGFKAQPEIGVVDEFGAARVDGDNLGAPRIRAQHLARITGWARWD